MFGRKDKYKSIMPDQPRSEAPARPNSIQHKVVKGPNKWFETGGLVPKNVSKQPHIRIELDDIADTPKVFIDGVLHENVQRIDLSWNKFDEGCYQIEMIDDQHKPYGIGQCKSK